MKIKKQITMHGNTVYNVIMCGECIATFLTKAEAKKYIEAE